MVDPVVIVAVIIVIIIAYLLLSGNALDKAFETAVLNAEMSCAAAIKSQAEADFDSAIASLTTAKTAQSASLNQYNAASPAPAGVNALSTRMDAIHCGNRASEKAAVDAIATATAANQAANKSGSPDDIQTAISTRDIALRSIKAAGAEATYVTAVLSAAITAFKALGYKNEENDNAFINTVAAANTSCNVALASQSDSDFADAIEKIATAKTNKLISTGQYSETNVPSAVKDAAQKLDSVNCGLYTLDKAAITATANATASCATANASKLPSDIQVALQLRAAAQKALSEAMAQYSSQPQKYVTTALAVSITSFNNLVYNNLVVDQDFIDAVDAADSGCVAALKSSVDADYTTSINQIVVAKTKLLASQAQYVGFTIPPAVADASVKLSKIPCATRAIDKPVVDAATTSIAWFKKAAASKGSNDLYNNSLYLYYFRIAVDRARTSYKNAGMTTTSSVYDAAIKSVADLDWAGLMSYVYDTYISAVNTAYNSCAAAKTSQTEADFSQAITDQNPLNMLYYAAYYYYYFLNYPSGSKLPDAITAAATKQSSLTCNRHSVDVGAINAIAAAVPACAGTDVATARRALSVAVANVARVVSAYGTTTNYVTTALTGSMSVYNSLNCSVATPFTLSGSLTTYGYLYIFINMQPFKLVYPSTVGATSTFSIPNVVPGDVVTFYVNRNNTGDPIGFIGSWNNSTGGVVNSTTANIKSNSLYSSTVVLSDVSSFPSGRADLSAITNNYPAGAKWVSPATDGYSTSVYYYYGDWIAT